MNHPLTNPVQDILTEVAPILGMHGGSIELVDITPENIVRLRFKGACIGCTAADLTLEYGLKEMILMRVEGVEDVIAVNDETPTHLPPGNPFSS